MAEETSEGLRDVEADIDDCGVRLPLVRLPQEKLEFEEAYENPYVGSRRSLSVQFWSTNRARWELSPSIANGSIIVPLVVLREKAIKNLARYYKQM